MPKKADAYRWTALPASYGDARGHSPKGKGERGLQLQVRRAGVWKDVRRTSDRKGYGIFKYEWGGRTKEVRSGRLLLMLRGEMALSSKQAAPQQKNTQCAVALLKSGVRM